MSERSSSSSEHGVLECRWCGRPIRAGRTCAEHADLEELDPHAIASKPPLTDAELGVPPPYRVGRRTGRRELY